MHVYLPCYIYNNCYPLNFDQSTLAHTTNEKQKQGESCSDLKWTLETEHDENTSHCHGQCVCN